MNKPSEHGHDHMIECMPSRAPLPMRGPHRCRQVTSYKRCRPCTDYSAMSLHPHPTDLLLATTVLTRLVSMALLVQELLLELDDIATHQGSMV